MKLNIAVLFVLLLFWGTTANAQIIRGPYLQQGTTSTMTIVWRTQEATSSQVWFGPSPNDMKSAGLLEGERTEHEFLLEYLQADSRYYYAVGDHRGKAAGANEAHFFRTAPTAGSKSHVRMWVLGDSGNGSAKQRDVRDRMLEHTQGLGPDIFLHMGDMAYSDGEDREFQNRFFNVYQQVLRNTVCWPTLGNHEGRSSDSGKETGPYYYSYVLPRQGQAGGLPSGTEAYYAFDYANIHFVVLDSHDSDRDPDGPMLTWLTKDLAATDQDWIIAYWHHPAYSKGTHDSDRERQLRQMRENALPILEAAGVDLVMAGHSHIYERSHLIHGAYDTPTTVLGHVRDGAGGAPEAPYTKPLKDAAGAVYITAGHGGAGVRQDRNKHPVMFFAEAKNGSVLIDVNGTALVGRNIRYDGEITDAFAIVKGRDAVIHQPNGGESIQPKSKQVAKWTGPTGELLQLEIQSADKWLKVGESSIGELTLHVPEGVAGETKVRVRSANSDIIAESRLFTILSPGQKPPAVMIAPPPEPAAPKPTKCATSPSELPAPPTVVLFLLAGAALIRRRYLE